MSVLLSVLVGVLATYILIYYSLFKGARFKGNVTLKGKTAIVTGSNTGIGKSKALDLAKRGARVILACRNKQKAEAAAYDIRKESGNPEVLYMHLDLASLKSVCDFAETFLKSEPRLDLLINNAAGFVTSTPVTVVTSTSWSVTIMAAGTNTTGSGAPTLRPSRCSPSAGFSSEGSSPSSLPPSPTSSSSSSSTTTTTSSSDPPLHSDSSKPSTG